MTQITKWFVIQRARLRVNGEEHAEGWHDWSSRFPGHAKRDAYATLARAQKLDKERRYAYQLVEVEERREIVA